MSKKSSPLITRVDLLRHGLPEGDECLRGHVDLPLTETGWQQMRSAVQSSPVYQQVLSSDLSRCRVFAEHHAAEHQLPLTVEPALRELNFGDWDGHTFDSLQQLAGPALGNYFRAPWTYTPPGGEPMVEFAARIESTWNGLLREYSGQRILVVTHAGVIRHLMAKILHMPLPGTIHYSALAVPYAAKISIEVRHDDNGQLWPQILWPSA